MGIKQLHDYLKRQTENFTPEDMDMAKKREA